MILSYYDNRKMATAMTINNSFFKYTRILTLILDKFLINFYEERSQATLSILGELSKNTQILFLTHHPHLIELAQQAVPGDCLVEHRLT